MAELYRQRIAALHERLGSEETEAQAVDILRRLVDRITLYLDGGGGWRSFCAVIWRQC